MQDPLCEGVAFIGAQFRRRVEIGATFRPFSLVFGAKGSRWSRLFRTLPKIAMMALGEPGHPHKNDPDKQFLKRGFISEVSD